MTIKIKAYQKYGIKTKELIDEFEFCCWETLKNWINSFPAVHKCPDCKKKELGVGK